MDEIIGTLIALALICVALVLCVAFWPLAIILCTFLICYTFGD